MAITRASNSGITTGVLKYDSMLVGRLPLPSVPTIGTATAGDTTASVAFTAGPIAGTTYRALSTPGSISATGTTSPISVTGLTNGTSYTFQVRAENSTGNSAYSSASNSVTPTSPLAYESIATLSGSGSSNTISFTSIPSTFTHLQIRLLGKSTQTGSGTNYNFTITFNGDTGANYAFHALRGQGSAAAASGVANANSISTVYSSISNSGTGRTSMFGVGIFDIHDYTSTSKNKTIRGFTGVSTNASTSGTDQIVFTSGLWYATPAAINRIDLIIGTGSWTTTSTFALYGIKS